MWPIYIPSKGRAKKCSTAVILANEGIPFKLVVEKDDAPHYQERFGASWVIVLPKSSQGIGYAREFINTYSRQKKEPFHWQLDDDIRSFEVRTGKRNVKTAAALVLAEAEKRIDGFENIGLVGLRHSVFAWSTKKQISFNIPCCSCFLVNNKTPAGFNTAIIEDIDFTMQVLFAGFCTLVFNRLLFTPEPVGKTEGGNQASGHYSKYTELARNTQRAWPNMFKMTQKKGETRLVGLGVSKLFTQRPQRKVPGEP